MTKILHISDTHLGNRQYGSDIRREDFTNAFETSINHAIDHNVDGVIHTGDLFDQRTPSLPIVTDCIEVLRTLAEEDIPFHGIVGNHDRKMDKQWLDLIRETGTAERLGQSPTMINDEVAIYGIDAVTKPAWHSTDFTLEEPPDPDAFRLLCLHQLFHPPAPEYFADHNLADVLDRTTVDIDAMALGDYHKTESTVIDGIPAWYAGSTERSNADEVDPRTVSLLNIEDGSLERRQLELDARPFVTTQIEFDEEDSHNHARNQLQRHQLAEKVAHVTLTGERTPVTSSDVYEMATDQGAAVCHVEDERGRAQIEFEDGPEGDIQGADALIEDQLAEQNLSEIATTIEERIRTAEGLVKNDIADTIEETITDAQAEAFDEPDDGTTASAAPGDVKMNEK